ncbi:hypothetical protein KY290_013415 [Solanum tuberosum]|uniref:Integrase core domain containing protein n=1 Tax=Solanum tuberosum TaxID=4113 RepID=A0ABQ7VLL1_SOLTU|nr:hypothetical protein KY285_012879 [Solanum tuberosum]KAH0769434.1 hypothetical protein KY290_013415 [Solanum tuberosum]
MGVTDGPLIPMMKDNEGKFIPKPKAQYREVDYRMLAKNAKAKCILVCGLGPDEFNRISSCTTAKQIWDTLVNAHEGTPQMESGESLQDMITRFTTIVNELSWEIKVTAIKEAKDLTTMSLDELAGNLKTYEMNVANTKMSKRSKDMILYFKATESDESDLDDEDIVVINKKLRKFLKKGGNYEKKFPPSKEKESDIAMYVAWGTGSDNSIEDNTKDVALMAMEDSESNIEKREEK